MARSVHDPLRALAREQDAIDATLADVLRARGDLPLYGMLRYFMGYADASLRPAQVGAGKRMRPSLLLYSAALFGGAATAMDLAVAVELFHNFTLIHDDIEDHDDERRGRPTVWKLWGVNHALNAGDAQAFVTTEFLLQAAAADDRAMRAARVLATNFTAVAEGQYLDLELAERSLDDPFVTVDTYLSMIEKKSAVLVGAAAAAGGIAAGADPVASDALFMYGRSLGMAYQIADDVVSIWGTARATGKRARGDLVERKKTYPVLFARDHGEAQTLTGLYDTRTPLDDAQLDALTEALDRAGARAATRALGETYVRVAKDAAAALPIAPEQTKVLSGIVDALVRFDQ